MDEKYGYERVKQPVLYDCTMDHFINLKRSPWNHQPCTRPFTRMITFLPLVFSYLSFASWHRRFNQIVSCCRYMVNQAGRGLVTLLTGSGNYETPRRGQKAVTASGTLATLETVEFARMCGVNVESLRMFCVRFSSVKAVTWRMKQGAVTVRWYEAYGTQKFSLGSA